MVVSSASYPAAPGSSATAAPPRNVLIFSFMASNTAIGMMWSRGNYGKIPVILLRRKIVFVSGLSLGDIHQHCLY